MFLALKTLNEKVFFAFVDLDGLKQVNDNLGHEAGDNLIREMAEAMKMTVTEDRLAMRYGGDEFVMFGRCRNGETEESILKELHNNMDIRNQNSSYPFQLKASIGISIYESKNVENLEKMIELADKKMYEEKRLKKMR